MATATRQTRRATATTLPARMGRKHKREPDPSTPSGQVALYLRELLRGQDMDELAERIGISRATLFNYTAGYTQPGPDTLDKLAKSLGKQDYRAMMPTDEFLASIGQAVGKGRRRKG